MSGIRRFLASRPISEFLNYQLYGAKIPFLATGGVVAVAGGSITHTFLTTGSNNFTIVSGSKEIEIVMMGGGGGGGTGNGQWASGGGGGGYISATKFLSSGDYPLSVGSAGIGQNACNNSNWTTIGAGGNSTFGSAVAGGGKGGNCAALTVGAGGTNTISGLSIVSNYSGATPPFSGSEGGAGGSNGLSAFGGISTYGIGAGAVGNYTPGTHATGNGNGGGGGPSCQNGHRGGGNGSQGFVIISYTV